MVEVVQMIVVATRLTVRRARYLPGFLRGSFAVAWQASKSPGFVAGALRAEPSGPVFWTLTAWESSGAVARFRESGAHARVAGRLADWGGEGAIAVWTLDGTDLPSW